MLNKARASCNVEIKCVFYSSWTITRIFHSCCHQSAHFFGFCFFFFFFFEFWMKSFPHLTLEWCIQGVPFCLHFTYDSIIDAILSQHELILRFHGMRNICASNELKEMNARAFKKNNNTHNLCIYNEWKNWKLIY